MGSSPPPRYEAIYEMASSNARVAYLHHAGRITVMDVRPNTTPKSPTPATPEGSNPLNTSCSESTSLRRELLSLKTYAPWLAVFTAAYLAKAFFDPKTVIVVGQSMRPGLPPDSKMLVMRHMPIERFDVVVFLDPKEPETHVVKRVIGLPGETIEYKACKLFVNGVEVQEPKYYGDMNYMKAVKIPEGMVYVLGDNRTNSADSRVYGPVSKTGMYVVNPSTIPPSEAP